MEQERIAGMNVVALTGDVSAVTFAATMKGDDACTFTLGVGRGGKKTWVRVNVYGSFVDACRERLKTGARVEVVGELMNRRQGEGDRMFTEVRCSHLIFS